MTEWKEYKLGEISDDVSYGYTASAAIEQVGPKFLRITDIRNGLIEWESVPYCKIGHRDYNKNKLEIGDIVVARTGATTGISEIIKHSIDAVFASYLIRFRINKQLANPFYVSYILKSKMWENYVSGIVSGSAQPGANAKQFADFSFKVPSLKTQNTIAEILSALDDKIELNNQINANLEALAQAIFKQWFIDFEFPDENGNPYKSSGGKMVESELGEIPKDWCLKSLYETACFMNGAAFKSEHFSADRGGLPIIKIVELKYGISPQTAYSVLEFDPKYRIDNGAVLYSWSGSPETSLEVFKWFGGAGWLNQHIFKVTTNNLAQEVFVYYLLRFLKPRLVAIAKDKQTTGLGHVTVADMKRLKVAYPCNKALLKFQQTVESIYYQHSSNELETKSLKELRDILLPRLISGKISID